MSDAILSRWLISDGSPVRVGEAICELETENAFMEMPAPATGVLRHLVSEGDVVTPRTQVAQIEQSVGDA